MNPNFPDWYRAASINPDGELLTKRWAAIHNFDGSVTNIPELARLFLDIGVAGEAFLTSFREAFQKKDPAFPAKGNDIELKILAGAELVDCWQTYRDDWSSYATLSLICGSCRGLRKSIVSEILEIAVEHLSTLSAKRFKTAKIGKAPDYSTEAQAKVKTLCDQSSVPSLAPTLLSIMQETVQLRSATSSHEEQISLLKEENDIVWWMLGEHNQHTSAHFSDISFTSAPLLAGYDLASFVRQVPGPLAAIAFLDRSLRISGGKPTANVKIKDAVNELPSEIKEKWVASVLQDEAMLDLCPLHKAMKLSLASQKDTWLPGYQQASRLKKDAALPARELAYQFYLERLLYMVRKEISV